jgi:putative membrane protein
MMMHGGNWVWGGPTLMTVALMVFGALLITAAVLSARYLISCGTESAAAAGPSTAERLLAERYSRGEIDEDEYRQKLTLLHQHR